MKLLYKGYFVIYICIFLFFSINVFAKNKYLPPPDSNYYRKPSDLWKDVDYKNMVLGIWIVYSDRDDLKIYNDPNETKVIKIYQFLDKFKVLEKREKYLKVEDYFDSKVCGWGRINEFILLTKSIRTENSITHKVVPINQLCRIKGDIKEIAPLRSPSCTAKKTGEKIKILDFAHIYSYYPDEQNAEFLLLGKKSYYLPKSNKDTIQEIILGWVSKERMLMWDTREALQPNIYRKHPIFFFKNKADLISYYSYNKIEDNLPTCDSVPACKNNRKDKELLVIRPDSEFKIDRKPWPPDIFRYSILKSNNDPYTPFEIGVSTATLDEKILQAEIREKIEEQRKEVENRDVVFLIDATMSMSPYISLVGEIAHNIMEQFKKKIRNKDEAGTLRFGVALYRDYLNKEYSFEIDDGSGYLTDKTKQVYEYLKGIKPIKSGEDPSDPAYYPEAVFLGLIKCIDEMNWRIGSRKLIIHIGDAGNHSRGKDDYTEKYIAKKLVDNDISYCAIQITEESKDNEHLFAQQLFYKQIKSIISHIAENTLQKIKENNDLISFPKKIYSDLQELKTNAENFSFSETDNVCTSFGNDRWLIRCIQSNNTIESEREYENTIKKQINKLASDIYDAKSILDSIRGGDKTIIDGIYDSEKNTSHKPFLMPGIINNLVKKIGEQLLNNRNNPETKERINEYVGIDKMEKINNPKDRQEFIQTLGKKELKRYLDKDVQFFTRAFVMLKRPGEKYKNDPDQLIKTILLQKQELERLLNTLQIFKYKYQCQLNPDSLKNIWREFIFAILGEQPDSKIDISSYSVKDLLQKQLGISLQSTHPILIIKYSEIEMGNISSQESIDELAKYLCTVTINLKKLYDSKDRYFKIFGENYIWIKASTMP